MRFAIIFAIVAMSFVNVSFALDHTTKAEQYATQAEKYQDDEQYKDRIFVLPSTLDDSEDQTTTKFINFNKLNEFQRDVIKLKAGENILLKIQRTYFEWLEDRTEATRHVIGITKEQENERIKRANEISKAVISLEKTRKEFAKQFIVDIDEFVEKHGEKAERFKGYSFNVRKWCQTQGILPKSEEEVDTAPNFSPLELPADSNN